MSDSFYQRVLDESPFAFIHLAWDNAKSKNLESIKSILTVLEADPTVGVLSGQAVTLAGETGNQEITVAKAFAAALGPMNAEDLHQEVAWTADQREVFDRIVAVSRKNFASQANLPIRIDPTLLLIHAGALVVQDPRFFDSMDDLYKAMPLGVLSKSGKAANTPALIALLKNASADTALDFVDSLFSAEREIMDKDSASIESLSKLVGHGQGRKGGLIDLLDAMDEKCDTHDGKSPTSCIRIELIRRRLDRFEEPMDADAVTQIAQVMGSGGFDPLSSSLKDEVDRYTELVRLFANQEPKYITQDSSLMGCLLESAVRRRCCPLIDSILPVLEHKARGKNNLLELALQQNCPVSMPDLRGTVERLKANGVSLDEIKADGKVIQASGLAHLASMGGHTGDEQKLATLLDIGIDVSSKAMKAAKFTEGDPHTHRMMNVIKAHAARRTAQELLANLDIEPARLLAP